MTSSFLYLQRRLHRCESWWREGKEKKLVADFLSSVATSPGILNLIYYGVVILSCRYKFEGEEMQGSGMIQSQISLYNAICEQGNLCYAVDLFSFTIFLATPCSYFVLI